LQCGKVRWRDLKAIDIVGLEVIGEKAGIERIFRTYEMERPSEDQRRV